MIPRQRIGHLDQVALVSERPPIDVRVLGGIDLRLHPERGLDWRGVVPWHTTCVDRGGR